MFGRRNRDDVKAQIDAIGRSQAVIEFAMDGTIITANQNFLDTLGYAIEEIRGRNHSMFVTADQHGGAEYRDFWAALKRGEFQAGEFMRIAKGGHEIWIEASYNPVIGSDGNPVKVIKIATEITAKKLRGMADASKLAAIDRAQAMIEFKLDGTIVNANENFLNALGYSLAEIEGKHHSMFMPQADRDSVDYREFWAALRRGEYQAGEFKRIGKGGREVWILASYNPVMDDTGKPIGVVKFATDVTASKVRNADLAGQIEAIGKSQAVIEFNMDGTIITANANFLGALGYSLAEIKGHHHSMFVEPSERDGTAYREFWDALNRGQYQAAEYKRIGKGGKEVYIQASYNPILDLNGKPFKVGEICDRRHAAGAGPPGQRTGPRHDGVGCRRFGRAQRLGAGDLRGNDQIPRDRDGRGRTGLDRRRAGPTPHRGRACDERHCRADQQHHRPDQPARAERHHRIRSRRRSRPRLCRGGLRGQEPRQPGQAGHRQDRPGDRQPQQHLRRRR